MTVEDHDSHNHFERAKRNSFYKEPIGKVALFVTAAIPTLRPYKGVLVQYLKQMDLSIKAEGANAVSRYKSYRHQFLLTVGSNVLPSKKFRHAMPIYRLALQYRDDPSVLLGLSTVFRSYDLYLPNQSEIDKKIRGFEEEFMTSSPRGQDQRIEIALEDSKFNFDQEVQSVIGHPDFLEFSKKHPFTEALKPQEHAIMLSKHGTARFNGRNPKIKGFAPAIAGATSELRRAHQITLKPGETYYDLLISLGEAIGNISLPSMTFKRKDCPPEGNLHSYMRRTVAFGAPGFKTRIIGIGDYTTQYVLSPLHEWSFKILRSLSSDYSFDHSKGFRQLSKFTFESPYLACYDLSNATDCMPVRFSESVLRYLLPNGRVIAPLWRRVMTELPSDNGRWYRVGQPMGLISSWSIGLALSHHFLVWISAKDAGILGRVLRDPKSYYGIVGDDLFIKHPALAHFYQIRAGQLGIKINLDKSLIVSEDFRISEFCHRNSFEGDEISALSPRLITKSFSDYACARELILKLRSVVNIGPRAGFASSFDEQSVVDLYQQLGSGFNQNAISTMYTIPVVYSGLSVDTEGAHWPPHLRIKFLVEKALSSLEYAIRSLYISNSGKDLFNELVQWSKEDLEPSWYFPNTPFMEFLRKQSTELVRLLSGTDVSQNALLSELALVANDVSQGIMYASDFLCWEQDYIDRLQKFAKPIAFRATEASRIEARTLAYKVFKLSKLKDLNPDNDIIMIRKMDNRLAHLLKRYSFRLNYYSSEEEKYADVFKEYIE